MLQALTEANIVPDVVLGTSIGAFNGSVIADDPGPDGVKRLVGFWEEVASAGIFKGGLFDRMRNGHAVYEIIRNNVEAAYETFPGKHYGIYRRHYPAASSLALEWFQQHLMPR